MGALTSKVMWGTEDAPDLVVPVTLSEGATMPDYATTGSAGMDLHAAERVELQRGVMTLVDTGVSMALPFMLYGQIRGRSGLALHHNVHVHPGVIDTDYRGTIKVMLLCHGGEGPPTNSPYIVEKGDRIAQLLVLPIARPGMQVVDALPPTKRGEGGFGSTGTNAVVVAQPASITDQAASSQEDVDGDKEKDDDNKENRPLTCSPGERV